LDVTYGEYLTRAKLTMKHLRDTVHLIRQIARMFDDAVKEVTLDVPKPSPLLPKRIASQPHVITPQGERGAICFYQFKIRSKYYQIARIKLLGERKINCLSYRRIPGKLKPKSPAMSGNCA
jgi:hypothetical protein